MTPPDPARIAAGLTADMVDLLMGWSNFGLGWPDAYSTSELDAINETHRRTPTLVRQFPPDGEMYLTPLGRAVRAALADVAENK